MKALQSEPVAVVNDRVSEVKRRLAAAVARKPCKMCC